MNNLKDKKLKKLINSKFLYTLPLVGMGLIGTHQTTHAMFPKKQPTTTQPPSTSRSTLTTTTSSISTTPTPTTSRLSTSALGSQSNLGARSKTTTTGTTSASTSKSSSSVSFISINYPPTKEELETMKMSGNLGESLKVLGKKAFYGQLGSRPSSGKHNPEKIANELSESVNDVSSSIFRKSAYDKAYKTGKLLKYEDMKKINEESKDFGDSMASIVSSNFKQSISNFNDLDINNEDINKTFEKTRIIFDILGSDIETAANHLLTTQVSKFIESNK